MKTGRVSTTVMEGEQAMIDVQVHFGGQGSESRALPALPRRGDYLEHEGKLFAVSVVVFDETVNAYAVQVGDTLASELRQQWAAWEESPRGPEPTAAQQGLF
jgi:hypothetical protein